MIHSTFNLKIQTWLSKSLMLSLGGILFFLNIAQAQYTSIPDAVFEQVLIDQGIDSEGTLDGQILTNDVAVVTNLTIDNINLTSLTGIEDFAALEFLTLDNSGLGGSYVLDLTNNSALKELRLINLFLSFLDVAGLTNLEELFIDGCNSLRGTIDLSSSTALIDANLNEVGSLTDFILGNHPNLTDLRLVLPSSGSSVSNLNLTGAPALVNFDILNGSMSSLDLSQCSNLSRIALAFNGDLTSLDLSANPNLNYIQLVSNFALNSLNVRNGNNSNINYFSLFQNTDLGCVLVDDPNAANQGQTPYNSWGATPTVEYSEDCIYTYVPDDEFEQHLIDLGLDILMDDQVLTQSIITVTSLTIEDKSLTSLTGIEDFAALEFLTLDNSGLGGSYVLDLTNNSALKELRLINLFLSFLDVAGLTNLEELFIDGCNSLRGTIDLSSSTALIDANLNEVGSLNNFILGNHPNLTDLRLVLPSSGSSVSNLNLTGAPALVNFDMLNGSMSSLDLSQCSNLSRIALAFNGDLTSLDLSANLNLNYIQLVSNFALNSLNVRNGNNSNINYFSLFQNTDLSCVLVDDPNAANQGQTPYNSWGAIPEVVYGGDGILIVCPDNITTNVDPEACEALVDYTAPFGSDNCLEVTITQTAGLGSGSFFPVGITTETFEISSSSGNSASCSFTVTVNDTEAPVISCPTDITVDVDAGLCTATVSYSAPIGTDNCAGATTAQIAGLGSGNNFPIGTSIETYQVTDAAGNSATCSFNITVNGEGPVISCPTDIVVNNDPDQCSAIVNYTAPIGTDNCQAVNTALSAGLGSGAAFPVGITTEMFTVTNANNQTSSCSFTVTVNDNEDLYITCPDNITVDNDPGQCSAVVSYSIPLGVDNCLPSTTIQTTGLGSGANFPIGTTTETYEVTNDNNESVSCSFTITVHDVEIPQFDQCPADLIVNNDPGECSAVVDYQVPVFTDNCGIASVSFDEGLGSGAVFPIGITTETYMTTDVNGNIQQCSFTVAVVDAEAPTIDCPTSIGVVAAPNECSIVYVYSIPLAEDNCAGFIFNQTAGLPSGSSFPVGQTTNTFEAVDAAGNITSCSFNINVVSQAINISCPTDIIVNTDPGMCSASVDYTPPVGTDLCGVPNTTEQTAGLGSGATFPIGTTTETFTVTNQDNFSTSCSFTITVNDIDAPSIDFCPEDITVNNDPGACSAIVNYTLPSGTNLCGSTTTQLKSGLGTGAAFPIGTTTETYEITDEAGNATICSFTVTIIDNEAPIISCPTSVGIVAPTGQCEANAVYINPEFSDNCSGTIMTQIAGLPSASNFPLGQTVNTFQVTDAAGNSATCSFNVNIASLNVSISCPGDITVNTDPGQCAAIVNYTIPEGTDLCGIPNTQLTAGLGSGVAFPIGTTTETYTATNSSGINASCSFTITVVDEEAPSIDCLLSYDVIATSQDGAVVDYIVPTGTDNCSEITIAQIDGLASGATFPLGTTSNTFQVTDVAGNQNTCSFDVTVIGIVPIVQCPDNIIVNTDPGACEAVVDFEAINNVGIPASIITYSHNPGTSFPTGTTLVSAEASNIAGAAGCDFEITVIDTEAPNITCPSNMIQGNDPGACEAVVTFNVPYTDNCNGAMLQQISGLANGLAFPLGTTINTFTVTDAAGNTASCDFEVVIQDLEAPEIIADLFFLNCTNGKDLYEVESIATDNCDADPEVLSVITIPQLENPTIEFKKKNKKKLKFNLTQNKITIQAPGNDGAEDWWQELDENGGITVADGQEIILTEPSNPNVLLFHFNNSGNLREVVNASMTLAVRAEDSTENIASISQIVYPQCGEGGFFVESNNSNILENQDISKVSFKDLKVFPNPFMWETNIEYLLEATEEVSVQIFDLNGRLINQLYQGNQDAGFNKLQWNGADQDGQQLPSGIYLIQFRTDNEIINKKVLLQHD